MQPPLIALVHHDPNPPQPFADRFQRTGTMGMCFMCEQRMTRGRYCIQDVEPYGYSEKPMCPGCWTDQLRLVQGGAA